MRLAAHDGAEKGAFTLPVSKTARGRITDGIARRSQAFCSATVCRPPGRSAAAAKSLWLVSSKKMRVGAGASGSAAHGWLLTRDALSNLERHWRAEDAQRTQAAQSKIGITTVYVTQDQLANAFAFVRTRLRSSIRGNVADRDRSRNSFPARLIRRGALRGPTNS